MSPFPAHPFGDDINAQTVLETMQTLRGWEDVIARSSNGANCCL